MQFQMIQLSCCFWKNGVFCNFHASRKFAIPELPQSNLFSEWGTNVIGYLSFAGNNSERVDKQLFLISLHCFLHAKCLFCQNIFVRDVCASILHKIIREELYCKCQKFPPELKNRSSSYIK